MVGNPAISCSLVRIGCRLPVMLDGQHWWSLVVLLVVCLLGMVGATFVISIIMSSVFTLFI